MNKTMGALIIGILVLYFIGNAYIYIKLLHQIATLPLWAKITISVIFWLLSILMFISFRARQFNIPAMVSRSIFNLGAIWMLAVLYMVLILGCFDIIKLIFHPVKYSFYIAMATTVLLMIYGNINYHHPKVNRLDIKLDKPLTSPIKIAAISDLHLGEGTGRNQLQRYINLIQSEQPDLIVIAGDLIDNSVRPLYRDSIADLLSQLHAPLGIYMVLGNHEYISGVNAARKFLENTPITLLRDSVVTLPNGLQIVGRDDKTNEGRKWLKELLTQTDSTKPVLVLDHQPYELANTDALGVDIQFSGHTHHGQVWPISIVTDIKFEQSHGYRKWKNTHIYVSSGLSLWGPAFRIGTNSDMGVITLR